jgi:hypothetical protein
MIKTFAAITLSLFCTVLSTGICHAQAPQDLQIVQGFHSSGGQILVEVSASQIPSGNVFFLGSSHSLHQLELTWDDSIENERSLTYVTETQNEPRELSVKNQTAEVQGLHRVSHMIRLTAQDLMKLQKNIAQNTISVHMLPSKWKSKFLFAVPGTGEYVLVKEPVFDFHGNYQVFIGRADHLQELAVDVPADWRQSAGRIRFKNGGGLVIPQMADLVSGSSTITTETSVLLRPGKGDSTVHSKAEVLSLPRLSRQELARFGFIETGKPALSASRYSNAAKRHSHFF